jgi:peptidoglycan/LPS O-acetylase OafA/YrhL
MYLNFILITCIDYMVNLQPQTKAIEPTKPNSYRPEIDGLRAVAVIAVIINHVNKELLPSGYLGVDIFFVISGFVITSSLAGRPSKDFRDFLMGFYTRRIKRLVPALLIFVLVTSLLMCLFNPTPEISLKTGITSLSAAYFLMPTRIWELSAGCLLFLSLKHSNSVLRALTKIPSLIVLGAIIAVFFAPSNLAWKANLAIVLLTAVLLICLHSGTTVYRFLTHPRVVYIGLISYSLYLWHWSVLSLSPGSTRFCVVR